MNRTNGLKTDILGSFIVIAYVDQRWLMAYERRDEPVILIERRLRESIIDDISQLLFDKILGCLALLDRIQCTYLSMTTFLLLQTTPLLAILYLVDI